ncbi:Protein msta, isoform B [Orchesella cincta]|uniref:Protein msta, isoform B n=1 Tax=Orchesella cincta TaxID=48709 RepID=A0A1D2N578_ORCCI|nr:Protein msta, isoform B [Orchesella cincta]
MRCKGKTTSVYHMASMLTSNCIPNASWVIQDTLDFYLRASAPIKTGERITISFVDPLLGTWDRRKQLWQEKYLSCTCSRCSDPTELSTFFSAIKCPGEGKTGGESIGVNCECEGYLLPTDPLAAVTYSWNEEGGENDDHPPQEKLCEERMAEWKCNVCLMRQPWGFIQNSLQKLKTQRDDDICPGNDGASSNTNADKPQANNREGWRDHKNYSRLQLLQTRVDQITRLVGSVAHMNHYLILKMENEILTSISQLLEEGQVPLEDMEKWAVRMVELCKKGLKVVNVLCPGLSKARGRLLYYLQQGLMINLLFKTSRAMRITHSDSEECSPPKDSPSHEELTKKFQELLLARKEILEIFAIERGNSAESGMLRAVQHDSIEMRVLKNHFKCHQNISSWNFKL